MFAILLLSISLFLILMASFMYGFVRFSAPIDLAVLELYPALRAASVALPVSI
jgi:hypothetical protein